MSNLNQVHHPLMTEIVPLSLHLFCGRYQLDAGVRPVLLHGPGVRGLRVPPTDRLAPPAAEIVGLRTMESLSLRLALGERSAAIDPTDATAFVRQRLTCIPLKPLAAGIQSTEVPPDFGRLDSFLMKHETKYIGQLGQTGNNELFNQIVTDSDRHATFALTWRATVNDMSQQRIAVGQHFVQLRNLYET